MGDLHTDWQSIPIDKKDKNLILITKNKQYFYTGVSKAYKSGSYIIFPQKEKKIVTSADLNSGL